MTELPVTGETGVVLVTLDEHRDRIMQVLEHTALDIGAELLAAKADHPGAFVEWVETKLPFGIDKAERLMAITRCYESCDEAMRAALPPAWTALYELTRLPSDRLQAAISTGVVNPAMTVKVARGVVADQQTNNSGETRDFLAGEAHMSGLEGTDETPPSVEPATTQNQRGTRLSCDIVARELVRYPRNELSPIMRTILAGWLGTTPGDNDAGSEVRNSDVQGVPEGVPVDAPEG